MNWIGLFAISFVICVIGLFIKRLNTKEPTTILEVLVPFIPLFNSLIAFCLVIVGLVFIILVLAKTNIRDVFKRPEKKGI